jgi:hypothetical protein
MERRRQATAARNQTALGMKKGIWIIENSASVANSHFIKSLTFSRFLVVVQDFVPKLQSLIN